MDDVAAVWPGCDSSGHEHVRATYIAIKDAAVLQFCDRCTHQKVNTLVSQGFDLTLLPGAREAVAHG